MNLYTYRTDTIAEGLDELTRDIVTTPEVPVFGDSIQFHNVVVQADSCEYNYDISKSWVTKARWTTLVNQYVNQAALDAFLDQCGNKLNRRKSHGVAFMRSQTVRSKNEENTGRVARRWGSCMLGWSFRRWPEPQLSMHSRSTYLGFLAPMDLGVAAKIAEAVGERVGLSPEEIGFTWHLEQATFHSFRSMPWWWADPENTRLLKAILKDKGEFYPAYTGIGKTLRYYHRDDKNGLLYGDMAFSQRRNFRMKYHLMAKPKGYGEQFLGPGAYAHPKRMPRLPSVMVSDLPLRSKHKDHNPDTEGDWEDDLLTDDDA